MFNTYFTQFPSKWEFLAKTVLNEVIFLIFNAMVIQCISLCITHVSTVSPSIHNWYTYTQPIYKIYMVRVLVGAWCTFSKWLSYICCSSCDCAFDCQLQSIAVNRKNLPRMTRIAL